MAYEKKQMAGKRGILVHMCAHNIFLSGHRTVKKGMVSGSNFYKVNVLSSKKWGRWRIGGVGGHLLFTCMLFNFFIYLSVCLCIFILKNSFSMFVYF